MNYIKKSFKMQKYWIGKGLVFLLLVMNFLPYIPHGIMGNASDYPIMYNSNPAYHYDGSLFKSGQWFGYYLVGGYLSQGNNDVNVEPWRGIHIPGKVPISITNFIVPDVGVKLKTGAYCLRPKSPNWPNTINVYEITPELCNQYSEISENQITERDIDALNVAMQTLGLTSDGVNFTNETYATMRFVCWYIGAMRWQSKQQFMDGIDKVLVIFDDGSINKAKFRSLCDKTATEIEKSIGATDTGYTDYMPAFTGRYSNQVPEIDFTLSEDGSYTYTYNFTRQYDKDWTYSCPPGVTVKYDSSSVTFNSTTPDPEGLIVGSPKSGSKLQSITPSGGILVCKSDEPEAQDMLIPYKSESKLVCYARATSGDGGGSSEGSEFPTLPDVKFYKYDETFEASYNISGEKYDAETNHKLKNAEFEILEMSLSDKPIILDNYWGSEIETWKGWKRCKRVETNENGSFFHSDNRSYNYIGTYCGGHNEQRQIIEDYEQFIEQCEEENKQAEEDNADNPNPDADSEPLWDTAAMWDHLAVLQVGYQEQIDACIGFTNDSENHFFHGENGINGQKSDMEEDKQDSYDAFVRIEYDYTVREIRPRNGYVLHGKHNEDHIIPVIRTSASESGSGGVIINPDNKTAGLPTALENIAVTRSSLSPKTGGFTKASVLIQEKNSEMNSEKTASLSDAEEIKTDVLDLSHKSQSFFNLDFILRNENSSNNKSTEQFVEESQKESEEEPEEESTKESQKESQKESKEEAREEPKKEAKEEPKEEPKEETLKEETDKEIVEEETTERDADEDIREETTEEEATGGGWKDEADEGGREEASDGKIEEVLIEEEKLDRATPSTAKESCLFEFTKRSLERAVTDRASDGDVYTVAFWEPDWHSKSSDSANAGNSSNNLFTWHIYDHRVEGQLHFNKRDMELSDKELVDNFSYGDSQGDATLEGAVYGLYAAQDIIHPDGKTGKVYAVNELVSVAVTDKNGDASFLTITEPSYVYGGVKNNYDGTYQDVNHPVIYPDYKSTNGSQWIGRPLILGRYYIKEVGRSEGYELSITGNDSNLDTNFEAVGNTEAIPGAAWVDSLAAGAIAGTAGTVITVKTEAADQGVELYFYNYPESTKFGIMRTGSAIKPGQSVVSWNEKETYFDRAGKHVYRNDSGNGRAYYRWDYNEDTGLYTRFETDIASPLYRLYKAGEVKKDLDGNAIPVKNAAGEIQYTSVPQSKAIKYMNHKAPALQPVTIPAEITNVKNTANQLLKEAGYYSIVPAGSKAPWYSLALRGADEQANVREILDWFDDKPFYNAAQVQSVTDVGGVKYALLRYDYMAAGNAPAVLSESDLYVKEAIPGGNGLYYYVAYPAADFTADSSTSLVQIPMVKKVTDTITMDKVIADYVKPQFLPKYETYIADTQIQDEHGNPVQEMEQVPEIAENTNVTATKTMDYLTDVAVYDSVDKYFTIRIKPERLTDAERSGTFKIETEHPGMTSVNAAGQTLHVGEYLKYILDVTAFACLPSSDWTGTYIKDALLSYDSGRVTYEDGDTRAVPIPVTERVIKQKIKVKKDIEVNADGQYENNTNQIHKDWFTENYGGYFNRLTGIRAPSVTEMENFRYKIYLKSNLEGIYRDDAGAVTWLNRDGTEVEIGTFKDSYPAKVQKLFTKVLHTTRLFKNSADAVVTNKELYSFSGNMINDEQNPGYTRIMETVMETVNDKNGAARQIEHYNYEKFFDGIYAANADKWHHTGVPIDTSFKPMPSGNEINTSDIARENAKASDAVRQFAITWYLNEEVKKLVQDNSSGEPETLGGSSYSDGLYDRALYQGIRKANNYLKPFFNYDLDSIYSINWDSETNGGKDLDSSTLSANTLYAGNGKQESYYYASSDYLPYGTYVLVEQQPERPDLNDFPNKHYTVDKPKEIMLPSVFEDGDITRFHSKYYFDSLKTPEQLLAEYQIRYNEEWPQADIGKKREYAIQANNHDGEFKVFKYGLDLDKISTNFTLSQELFHPSKDYYLFQADKTNVFYHPNSKVSAYYRYASISEQSDIENSVPFPADKGVIFKDGVMTMQGMQKAYEGKYAPMLVPWSVMEPAESDTYYAALFTGYADSLFTNTFYSTRLRIEKLDAETGENVLHDNAVFAIYAAEREDSGTGDGAVKFYDRDTLIRGTKEFLTAMGARNINPFKRILGAKAKGGNSFTGIVPAGTPICRESEQIFLTDSDGSRSGQFLAFSTMRDGLQADEENLSHKRVGNQNAGYLEIPKPLGAGAYVLCEIKSPSGYSRIKPVAIEIYSDRVAYYQDGEEDKKVISTLYQENGMDTARIYMNNTPVSLEISKIKTTAREVIYQTDTRFEGTEFQLKAKYGAENLEFAYNHSGTYLGYGWKKGTLEYLISRKEAKEAVEIVYQDGIFAGYGRITRQLESPSDQNQYVAGAKLTLYDAIEIKTNSMGGDYGYDGVCVTRDGNSNVQSIRIEKGYAGEKILFSKEKGEDEYTYADEMNDTGVGTWNYKTIQREEAEILFYSLAGLTFCETGKDGTITGYDKDGNIVQVKYQESIYALKNGRPVFELTGSKLNQITYSSMDKCFKNLEPDVKMYHLDENGIRDALANPVTGMAYVEDGDRILVWPVNVAYTSGGAVITREKINTYRIATIHSGTVQEYVTGTLKKNKFEKRLNPVLNPHGLPIYYQRSDENYTKGRPVYDIDGDYVRYRYLDGLVDMNLAAYGINPLPELHDIGKEQDIQDDRKLYHRQGESYVMENTWMSGEDSPNDPLNEGLTSGQTDVIKRVVPGTYILEELVPPVGYTKGFPKAVFLEKKKQPQNLNLENENIKVEIVKTDAADNYKRSVRSDYTDILPYIEGKGTYSYSQIAGSRLALYRAKKVYTVDSENHPSGYYLEKIEQTPAVWTVENPKDNVMIAVSGEWVTDGKPRYFEGIPSGCYILEELSAASGYVRSRMEIEVKPTGEMQRFQLKNDHTKLEVFKYCKESGSMRPLPNSSAAGLTVYEAVTDAQGNIVYKNGLPEYDSAGIIDSWTTDDLKQYTGSVTKKTRLFAPFHKSIGFLSDFESAYEVDPDISKIIWLAPEGEKRAELTYSKTQDKTESKEQVWLTEDGKQIRITIYKISRNGTPQFRFEYQFNYRELSDGIKVYDTVEGMHRIDYIPFNAMKNGMPVGNYVLVEHKTPAGFEAADPKAIILIETGDVQRFSLKNEEKYIHIDKIAIATDQNGNDEAQQVPGVVLGLYRADADGGFPDASDMGGSLVESWTSGQDGTYTEEDKLKGDIVRGYEPGDLRPHRISKVPYGKYYIAELNVPDYMGKNPPQLIEVRSDKVPVYNVVNRLAKGRLLIRKTAEDTGELLAGARFEVKNEWTKESWVIVAGTDGTALLDHLQVGSLKADGTVEPHWYQVKEITPPDFYQSDPLIKRFKFDGTGHEALLTYGYEVKNKPTSIKFTKTNFSNDMFVEGAVVAIYKARAADGEYIKDGEAIEVIKTGSQGFTITKKLKASHAYIAQELKAPEGMLLAKPLLFILNARGTGIGRITNDFSSIILEGDEQAIEWMEVSGRVATGVTVELKDTASGSMAAFQSPEGSLVITEKDGIRNGAVYEITEYTSYSDGNREVTRRETTRITLDKNGTYQLPSRTFKKTTQTLNDSVGTVIDKWDLEGDKQNHTIHNPVTQEPNFLMVTSDTGKNFKSVESGAHIKYRITYNNTGSDVEDLEIRALMSEGLEFLRSTPRGTINGQNITWNPADAPPGKEETFEVVAVVTGKPGSEIFMSAKIGEESCVRENTVALKNSLTVKNSLAGTGKDNTDQFTYHVALKDSQNKPLTGYYAYHGTESGRIKGEGEITLSGDGYITFDYLPDGSRYEITQEKTYGYELKVSVFSGIIGNYPASAVFINLKNDETIRDVLTKNGEYVLSETTAYTDGSSQVTGKYRFRINESLMVDNIDMLDKPIEVIFSKRDFASGAELAGGNYQIIDAETLDVLHEFTKNSEIKLSGKQMRPGKSYILREVEAPNGYAYANDIKFTVSGSGIPEKVVMHDVPTQVEIVKINESGALLWGSRHQILNEEKQVVIPEFTFKGKPFMITGKLLAGNHYYLRETQAPSGYMAADDVLFTVPMEPGKITVTMIDPKEPEKSGDSQMHLKKIDGVSQESLEGFEFTIYKSDGTYYMTVVTGTDGYAKFDMPPDGRYIYEETRAKDGYLLPEKGTKFSFAVENQAVDRQSVVVVENYKSPDIPIRKISKITGDGLPHAEFIIRNQEGTEVFTGITDKEGYLSFRPGYPGVYTVEEKKAPDGYIRTEQKIEFHVHADGTVTGTFSLQNQLETSKKGYIIAGYSSKLSEVGYVTVQSTGVWGFYGKLPETGELILQTQWPWRTLPALMSILLVIIVCYIQRRKQKSC